MIPTIYDKNEIYIGTLFDTIECLVTEERNGEFELTLAYPVNLFDINNATIIESLKEQNIIIADANDTLLNQKFRIYNVAKSMNNRIRVLARHISFDLAYDIIEGLDIKGQKADYVANQIFLNSQFSKDYKAVTDIIMTADYKIDLSNCLEAIAGKEGSIIDTYGTGSELLRDNKNIAILTKRGFDKGVTIEYRKNMTGIETEEDDTELITWIYPMAKYTNENEEEVTITLMDKFVKSDKWELYSHPYIRIIDFSDSFEGEIPTEEKLIQLSNKHFQNSKCDIPKINYEIEFIPLSNCVGFENIEDKISLCDIVTIIDDRYKITTKSKVIKATYNVIRERYELMELGEPRTKLGDVIGNIAGTVTGTAQGGAGGGKPTEPTFPDIIPNPPIANARVYGFNSIEVSWSYESKPFYEYELYASLTENFIPNEQDLIFKGKASVFLHIVNPNQKWFFKVCVVNTYDKRSDFSVEVSAETKKIEDLSNYVENLAIGNALIGELDLGRGWFGQLIGTYINAKMLQVTRGDGLITLDIDSDGNVTLNVKKLEINSEGIYTKEEVNMELDKIVIGTRNFIITNKLSNYAKWNDLLLENDQIILIPTNIEESRITLFVEDFIPKNEEYTLSGYATINDNPIPKDFFTSGKANTDNTAGESIIEIQEDGYFYITETYNGTSQYILNTIVKANTMDRIVFTFLKFEKGTKATDWTPSPEDIQANIELIEQTLGTQINSEILASQKELLEKIAEEYPTAEDVQIEIQKATSSLVQTDKDINMNFETLDKIVVDLGDRYEIFEQVVSTNINFSQEGIILGKNDSPFKVKLDNQQLSFIENENVVAYINNNTMFINNAQIKEYLSIGNDELGYFSWVMRNNGNMTLKWVGGK